jgi:hypothetical protein
MIGRHARSLLLAFAIVNATLYSCFLPLWEGFDEPFHYAYVQSLAQGHLPVFGQSKVSAEIDNSFADVPLSRFLSGSTGATSFEQWFALPVAEKQTRVGRTINPALREQASTLDNYEAQQAPLAYMLLVPFDLALSHVRLRWRVLALRLILANGSALLLWYAVTGLCRLLSVSYVFALAATACIFGSQMLWATVAHIGNDYLAVPLTLLFLVWLGKAARSNGRRDLLILAGIFSAGLLTKAYFLAFAPVFFAFIGVELRRRMGATALLALLIPLISAGPWYWHNHRLYGSFSGTQQSVAGIGFVQVLSAVPKIPWVGGTLAFLHWSLWTGNWSFLSFSKATLNLELILVGTALALYLARFRRFSAAEWWGLAACACFIAGLIYQTGATYIHTHGVSLFAEPWYWQGVVCWMWVLAWRGLEQSGTPGRILGALTVLVSAWIALVTYVGKLFPLYGGGFERATITRVWVWWTSHPMQDLSATALAPPFVLCILLVAFLLILAAQAALLVRDLVRRGRTC